MPSTAAKAWINKEKTYLDAEADEGLKLMLGLLILLA